MTKYSLSTWMGQQMIEVEDITAEDDRYAIAYASGRLDERLTQHGGALMRLGVCYRLDRRAENDRLPAFANETRIGDWFSVSAGGSDSLVWQPHTDVG